jgi:hypothetical protein
MLSRALEMAQKQSEAYSMPVESINHVSADNIETEDEQSVIGVIRQKCFFCGYDRHPRNSCPAREAVCRNCDKKGHFSKVCRSKKTQNSYKSNTTTSAFIANLAYISANLPGALSKTVIKVKVNNMEANGLVDTGGSSSFIDDEFVQHHKINVFPKKGQVILASAEH